MALDPTDIPLDYSYTQNRDLSWLRFNQRVLEEAQDSTVPLMERLRFLSIFCSNLDEFFMIRMGSTYELTLSQPEHIDNKSGWTPAQIFKKVFERAHGLNALMEQTFSELETLLAKQGVVRLYHKNWADVDRKYARHYFRYQVLPVLSAQVLDSRHPFPHVASKALHVGVELREKTKEKEKKKNLSLFGLIPVPDFLPQIVFLPGPTLRYILLEEIVLEFADEIYPYHEILDKSIFCLTRNADLTIDEFDLDPREDYREQMRTVLKKRSRLAPICMEVQYATKSSPMLSFFCKQWGLKNQQVFYKKAPLNFGFLSSLIDKIPTKQRTILLYPPYTPQYPPDWQPDESKIRQIQERDRLLYFPYDSIEPFLQLIKEASEDPEVLSIKIAIYRLANRSRLVEYLLTAVENGKEVLVLVELRARFDEANNINWTEILEEGGCKVIYGLENYKAHAKICLITRRNKDRVQYITQIGTGNYNEKTVHLYTDLSLLTADPVLGEDANRFFSNMSMGYLDGHYESLLVAPKEMKPALLKLIDWEIEKARRGETGFVGIKANSLSERELLDKLSEASRAGVRVRLMIRGICCLLPQVLGATENIEIRSIVGRFLEHPRIYLFGCDEKRSIYIGSADGMTRNLDYRVEILCPVKDKQLKQQIHHYWKTMWQDNCKARTMLPNGDMVPVESNPAEVYDAQKIFMQEAMSKKDNTDLTRQKILNTANKYLKKLKKPS